MNMSIWIIMASIALTASVADIYIPALTVMTSAFATTPELIKLSLTVSFIGACVASPLWGPLADDYGRRRVFISVFIFFVISCGMCAYAPTIEVFLAARFLQGVTGCAAQVVGIAVTLDRFKPIDAARYIAYIGTLITMSLVLAPIAGGYITEYFDWRMSFILIGALALGIWVYLYFYMEESLDPKLYHPFSIEDTVSTYKLILLSKKFWLYALIPSLLIGGIIGYQTNIAFIFMDQDGMGPSTFGLYTAVPTLVNSFLTFLVGRMVATVGFKKLVTTSVILTLASSVLLIIASLYDVRDPTIITAIICLFSMAIACSYSPLTTLAMTLFPTHGGAVSAMLWSTRVLIIGMGMTISMALFNNTMMSIALGIAACSLVVTLVYRNIKSFTPLHQRKSA